MHLTFHIPHFFKTEKNAQKQLQKLQQSLKKLRFIIVNTIYQVGNDSKTHIAISILLKKYSHDGKRYIKIILPILVDCGTTADFIDEIFVKFFGLSDKC